MCNTKVKNYKFPKKYPHYKKSLQKTCIICIRYTINFLGRLFKRKFLIVIDLGKLCFICRMGCV